jgi:hypothetical protein
MFKNYQQLLEKIDSFVSVVIAKHPDSFRCGPGCAKCCVGGITVWRVEADHIAASNARKARNASNAGDACAFLNDEGLCTIYEARPVVCRLWGAPLMIPAGREPEWGIRDHTSDPRERGTLTCCDLNFRKDLNLQDLQIGDAINVETVIRTLAAINHVYCKENGLDPEERTPLLPS